MKKRFRRFLDEWGRDIAIAAAGATLGLVVLVFVQVFEKPPPEPKRTAATNAPVAETKKKPTAARPNVKPDDLPKRQQTSSLPTAGGSRSGAPSHATKVDRPPPSLPAWQRFAARHEAVGGRPMVAVIIDDMGIDRKRGARAIALRGPLTMAFLTYARDLKSQVDAARRAGHEVMVHVPMEPEDHEEKPGPHVISTDQTPDAVRRQLDWALSRFDGFVGINNHMGSRYTADAAGMTLVLREIGRRGLFFIDSRTTPKTVARRLSRKLSVPFAERDVFIDDDPRPRSIAHQLDEVVRVARKKKYVIAIGHPREETLAALEKWLPTLYVRGFVPVPVSAIVRYRLEQDQGG